MTGQEKPAEQAGLPDWLYPLGFWVAVGLLTVGVLFPKLAFIGVTWVASVPVLAAIWVALSAWNRDPKLRYAALAALAGLIVVFIVKQFI